MSDQDLTKKIDTYFASLPIRLESTVEINIPNAPVRIYKGLANIRYDCKSIECAIEILFKWQPRRGVEFFIEDDRPEVSNMFMRQMVDSSTVQFLIDGFEFGQVLPTNANESDNKYVISGLINPPVQQYNKLSTRTTKYDKIVFHLFNFVNIHGSPVRKANQKSSSLARLHFPAQHFDIVVDCILNNQTEWGEISKHGGYGLTHVGELILKDNAKIDQDIAYKILNQFDLFLSFLTGRKVTPFFMTGKRGDEILWVEYNNRRQEPYMYQHSWLPQLFDEKISAIWAEFYQLAQDNYDLDTLYLVIHWYLSANKGSGGLEGSIILLQNAFELLFRWIIVERKNMISPDGGDALRASDKIRMLLYLINCSTELPTHYQKQFEDLIKQDRSLIDFPFLFTEIRNSYVHANRKKREKINNLPSDYLYAMLTCGLYYIELLILYLLNYDGKIAQRISTEKFRGGNEVLVPWNKSVEK
ncbi:hypothetical protein [Parapedobacter lycopersici]|uniref:hypothetical protein n=1 Tax=Parapedobacter lycopersici TaxID=1864939 RepID=UPI00214D2062|nr:hypothetical protein [Parapedobacter lycopersici]